MQQAAADPHNNQADKLVALSRLAAGMAHEFNNVLMVVLGSAELGLLSAPADSPLKPALEQIMAAAQRGADFCKQMMAYAGRQKIEFRPTDLSRLLQALEPALAAMAAGASLNFDLARDLPAIDADEQQLGALVEQLVRNATEALPAAGGTITVSAKIARVDPNQAVWSDADLQSPCVCLEVTDTGRGIEPGIAHSVFDPFFTTKTKGRGFGLAMVLGIVRRHRGAIGVECQAGHTHVRVFFPQAPKSAGLFETDVDAAFTGTGSALVIDADPIGRTLSAALLEHFGFDTLPAADVPAALALAAGHGEPIKLVLLSPSEADDAAKLVAQLRERQPTAKILLAGSQSAAGADGWIAKPVRANRLGRLLRELFAS